MKFASRVCQAVTSFNAGVMVLGAAVVPNRTLAQVITAGAADPNAIKVGDTVCFVREDASLNWEEALWTVTAPDTLTQTSITGSNGVALSGAVTTYCDIPGSFLSTLLSLADGLTLAQLPAATAITAATKFECSPDGTTSQLGTADQLWQYFVSRGMNTGAAAPASPTETLVIGTIPTPQTVGTGFTVSGTWTGVQPTGLNYALTDNGGTQGAFNTATGAIINANGTWSFTQNPASASTSRTMVVQDSGHTSVISAPSNPYVVNAAATATTYTITARGYSDPKDSVSTSLGFGPYGGNWMMQPPAMGAGYWDVSPAPASCLAGWGTSSTVEPPTITKAQSDAGANGMAPMAQDATTLTNFNTDANLWIPASANHDTTSGPWFFWIKPAGGVAVRLSRAPGSMVTGA